MNLSETQCCHLWFGRRPLEWGAEPQGNFTDARCTTLPENAQGDTGTGNGVSHLHRLRTWGQPTKESGSRALGRGHA